MAEVTVQQAIEAGRAHHAAGRLGEAEAVYRRVLEVEPGNARALCLLGVLAHQQGRTGAALELVGRAAALAPGEPDYLCNLGVILAGAGRVEEAIGAYRGALALRPNDAETQFNLGNALLARGERDAAAEAYRAAVAVNPGLGVAWLNLARTLREAGREEEAAAAIAEANAAQPELGRHYLESGESFLAANNGPAAEAAFSNAATLRAGEPRAWLGLGGAFLRQDRPHDAIGAYRRAIELAPESGAAHFELAKALAAIGELGAAIEAFTKSAELAPEPGGESYRLLMMLLHPGYSPERVLREHGEWARRFADPLTPANPTYANDASPERRLRVGYVSPDFRDHPVGLHMLPLFREHDKSAVEVFCYSTSKAGSVPEEDPFRRRFRAHADHWRDVGEVGDEALADLVRADGIDVLVDLALHTPENRLLTFARKTAPVQVTFAGYPGTTGVAAIDYRLTDPYLDPPGENDELYAEESFRLPHTFWCYEPGPTAEVAPLPASSNGFVTFGCLNNFPKLNEPTLRLWAGVLRAVEGSHLALLASEGPHRRRVADVLAAEGISPDRVKFAVRRPPAQYLELYHHIDIGLDTLPYNGHTTALDSMWMGVPVVTRVGKVAWSRAGWSQLSNLGMTELAAQTPERFVEVAVGLARDLPRLAEIRASLRERMKRSPIGDAKGFARGIEAAYRAMWRRWCAGRR